MVRRSLDRVACLFALLTIAHGQAALPLDPFVASLDGIAAPYVGQGCAPGWVVGVLRDGETVVRGYGRTSVDGGPRPGADTVYEVGSLSKIHTGLLLAELHLLAELRLEDPVARHLPPHVDVPELDGAPVRLLHLATHTSGLPRMPGNFAPAEPRNPYADYTVEHLLEAVPLATLAAGPGERYAYSNFGAGLLGHALARRVADGDYGTLLAERICAPLGLEDTSIDLTVDLRARVAPPHDASLAPTSHWDIPTLAGAGGIRSTMADLLVVARLHLDGVEGPLTEAARLARRVHARPEGGPAMGLGWHHVGGRLGHEGETGGYHTYLLVHPGRGVVVAVLANASGSGLREFVARAEQLALGADVAPCRLEPRVAVPPEALDALRGRYDFGRGETIVVRPEDGDLLVDRGPRGARRLVPVAGDRFADRAGPGEVRFERGEDGEVAGLVWREAGRSRRAVRAR